MIEGVRWFDPGVASRTWRLAIWKPDGLGGGTRLDYVDVTTGAGTQHDTPFNAPINVTASDLFLPNISFSTAWWLTCFCVSDNKVFGSSRDEWGRLPHIGGLVSYRTVDVTTGEIYPGGSTWSWYRFWPMNLLGYSLAEEYLTPLPTTSAIFVSSIDVVARDVIKVNFNTAVAVEANLMNAASYQITGGVAVASVLPLEERTTTSVFLVLSPKATFGGSYSLTIPSIGTVVEYLPGNDTAGLIYTPAGVPIQTMSATWSHHQTKTDIVLSSLPGVYDGSIDSRIRSILQAVTISDEKIGGSF